MSEWQKVTRRLYTPEMWAALERGDITQEQLDRAIDDFQKKTGTTGGVGEMTIKFRVVKRKDKEHGER